MNKLLLAIVAIAFATIAVAQSVTDVNGILADASGRTLYTFDNDAENKSNCNGGCALAWPPYLVNEGDRNPANIGVVRRNDNTLQWAVKGKPLYYFAADTQRGDMKGDGQDGVWHAVQASEIQVKPTSAAASRSDRLYDSYGEY